MSWRKWEDNQYFKQLKIEIGQINLQHSRRPVRCYRWGSGKKCTNWLNNISLCPQFTPNSKAKAFHIEKEKVRFESQICTMKSRGVVVSMVNRTVYLHLTLMTTNLYLSCIHTKCIYVWTKMDPHLNEACPLIGKNTTTQTSQTTFSKHCAVLHVLLQFK